MKKAWFWFNRLIECWAFAASVGFVIGAYQAIARTTTEMTANGPLTFGQSLYIGSLALAVLWVTAREAFRRRDYKVLFE